MSTCPNCKKEFDDDFKRYVLGSVTNTIKMATHITLRVGGSILGGAISVPFGSSTIARSFGKVGKEVAEGLGCGEKDMNGWDHECPFCGHRWN